MPNIKSLQSKLKKIEEQRAALEQQLAREASRVKFASLPRKVGLKTIDTLIYALIPFGSPVLKGEFKTLLTEGAAPSAAGKASKGKKRRRRSYSAAKKAAAKAAMEKGNQSVSEVSRALGIPLPTLNLWRKTWGLTKPRKAPKAKAPKAVTKKAAVVASTAKK